MLYAFDFDESYEDIRIPTSSSGRPPRRPGSACTGMKPRYRSVKSPRGAGSPRSTIGFQSESCILRRMALKCKNRFAPIIAARSDQASAVTGRVPAGGMKEISCTFCLEPLPTASGRSSPGGATNAGYPAICPVRADFVFAAADTADDPERCHRSAAVRQYEGFTIHMGRCVPRILLLSH